MGVRQAQDNHSIAVFCPTGCRTPPARPPLLVLVLPPRRRLPVLVVVVVVVILSARNTIGVCWLTAVASSAAGSIAEMISGTNVVVVVVSFVLIVQYVLAR